MQGCIIAALTLNRIEQLTWRLITIQTSTNHSLDDPFAKPGDSGSLVYSVVDEKIVPLGIHITSSEGRSIAYLLSPWFDEASSLLDVDIRFCDPIECQHS